jgi:predicted  nucleic acid-binding Zn-ribbon protein
VLDPPDALGAVQDAHWQIQRAHCDYQHAAEERRQLAADIDDVIRAFVDELVASGRSERKARDANVNELAGSAIEHVATVASDGDPIGEILTRCQGPGTR